MTISSNLSTVTRNGNGVATSFSFPFKVWDTSQLDVYITDPDGATTTTSNFTATLSGSGGNVVYPAAGGVVLPTGWTITIIRSMPFTQNVDLVNGQAFYPDVIEQALDQLTATCQQLDEGLSRSVKVDPGQSDPTTLLTQIQTAVTTSSSNAAAAAGSATDADASKIAAQTVATAAAEAVSAATAQANAAHASALAAAQSAAEAAATPATTTARGIGRVATSDDLVDGATINNGPAFLAAGVHTSVAAAAGKVPVADSNGHLPQGWLGSMLCNVRTVITVSGTFTAPVSGWYRVRIIAGGGPGCSFVPGACTGIGTKGGDSTFNGVTATGGAPGHYNPCRPTDTNLTRVGTGGYAGQVIDTIMYLTKDVEYPVVVGAGGVPSVSNATLPGGHKSHAGTYSSIVWFYSEDNLQIGGSAGGNGTEYGGGGGAITTGSSAATGTGGGLGQANGATANWTYWGTSALGGAGGQGALIVEYFDPSVTS